MSFALRDCTMYHCHQTVDNFGSNVHSSGSASSGGRTTSGTGFTAAGRQLEILQISFVQKTGSGYIAVGQLSKIFSKRLPVLFTNILCKVTGIVSIYTHKFFRHSCRLSL